MKTIKPLKLILAISLLTIMSGCSFYSFDKEVYVAPGQIAELAKPISATCWITNKKTGKREKRIIKAQSGWFIGRVKNEGK